MPKQAVFIDSSVFIAALLSSIGGSFYILTALYENFVFQTSEYVIDEINEVLENKFIERSDLRAKFHLLLGVAGIKILPYPQQGSVSRLAGIVSKKDAPILASAIEHSNILLTLDNEFFGENIVECANKVNLLIFKPKDLIQKSLDH